jgi:hypothetical protein
MKHCLIVLLVAFAACSDPPENPAVDAGDPPPSDGALPVPPDANPNSDINPPLTPDDPCRQLKRTFDFEVRAADMATLGNLMAVTYTLTNNTRGLLLYENEELIEEFTVPGEDPRLFYARDEIHLSVRVDGRLREYHVNGAAGLVDMQRTYDNSNRLVSDRTAEDDLLVAGAHNAVLLNTTFLNAAQCNGNGESCDAGWWPVRSGDGAAASVRLLRGAHREGSLALITSDIPLVPGMDIINTITEFDLMAAGVSDFITVATASRDSMVVAMQQGAFPLQTVQYRRIGQGADSADILRTSDGSLASLGAHAGDSATGLLATYFVEQRWAEDLMSSRWVLVEPVPGTDIAVGRDGYARQRIGFPGTLLSRDGHLHWAGPTIQDGNTPNYPADAIAVCSVPVP